MQGASALAHKLPGNLIEKAFSRSLDLINPLRELERTPSQVPTLGRESAELAMDTACKWFPWTASSHRDRTSDSLNVK